MNKVIADISSSIKVISPLLHGIVRKAVRKTVDALTYTYGVVTSALRRFAVTVRRLFVRAVDTPLIVKVYFVLLTFFPIFALWQFFAYELSQATFISVNLLLALLLTISMLRVSLFSHKTVEQMKDENESLNAEITRRDAELAKLKADIFEFRNKARRANASKKSATRLVEAALKLKPATVNQNLPLQFLVDAISKVFDVSGIIAFKRQDPESQVYQLAGKYALSEEIPTTTIDSTDGFLGQVISDGKPLAIPSVPKEYLTAVSGLGKSRALNVYALPLTSPNGEGVEAVIEVACFAKLPIVSEWESVQGQLSDII